MNAQRVTLQFKSSSEYRTVISLYLWFLAWRMIMFLTVAWLEDLHISKLSVCIRTLFCSEVQIHWLWCHRSFYDTIVQMIIYVDQLTYMRQCVLQVFFLNSYVIYPILNYSEFYIVFPSPFLLFVWVCVNINCIYLFDYLLRLTFSVTQCFALLCSVDFC